MENLIIPNLLEIINPQDNRAEQVFTINLPFILIPPQEHQKYV